MAYQETCLSCSVGGLLFGHAEINHINMVQIIAEEPLDRSVLVITLILSVMRKTHVALVFIALNITHLLG